MLTAWDLATAHIAPEEPDGDLALPGLHIAEVADRAAALEGYW